MIVAGIDYSTTKINVVVLADEEQAVKPDARRWVFQIPPGSGDAFDRARVVKLIFPHLDFWERHEVAGVALEEPRGPGNGALLRIQGALLACLPHDLLVQPLLPSQWRKHAGLAGNATKEQVREFVEERDWRARNWSQDDCDAYCLALAMRKLVKE